VRFVRSEFEGFHEATGQGSKGVAVELADGASRMALSGTNPPPHEETSPPVVPLPEIAARRGVTGGFYEAPSWVGTSRVRRSQNSHRTTQARLFSRAG